ncbi:MAG: T9SS type A sorting domain-containing protein, partial [Cyclobacteriaceae bacterium]
PEMAFIEVSSDNVQWVSLPNSMCRTSFVDISPAIEQGLPFVRYIRITDATNRSWFGRHADGFDVDGLITCRADVLLAFDRLTNARTTLSNEVAFNPDFFNLVPDEEVDLTFNVYPNPIIGPELKINYETENEIQGSIRIVDLMGKTAMTQQFQAKPEYRQLRVQTGELRPGLYLLQVLINGEVTYSSKIQKQ